MPLSQLRQAITRLILPTADLGLREQTVDPLLFPDDLPPILAVNAGQSAAGPKLQALGINGGILPAVASEGNNINVGQVAVTLVTTLLVPANPNRFALYLQNAGSNTIFIGPLGVIGATGHAIVASGSLTLKSGAAIYGVCNNVGSSLTWLEEVA